MDVFKKVKFFSQDFLMGETPLLILFYNWSNQLKFIYKSFIFYDNWNGHDQTYLPCFVEAKIHMDWRIVHFTCISWFHYSSHVPIEGAHGFTIGKGQNSMPVTGTGKLSIIHLIQQHLLNSTCSTECGFMV
jgi:hypothetical protein